VAVALAERGAAAQCEMGGQNAAVVLADADVEAAAGMIASARWATPARVATGRDLRQAVVGQRDALVDAIGGVEGRRIPAARWGC
jgi:aldehyde dehydrogenase (NAD+)